MKKSIVLFKSKFSIDNFFFLFILILVGLNINLLHMYGINLIYKDDTWSSKFFKLKKYIFTVTVVTVFGEFCLAFVQLFFK